MCKQDEEDARLPVTLFLSFFADRDQKKHAHEMTGIKWMSILAVVAVIGLTSAAPVDNSLDDLNPLSIEVSFTMKMGNFKFRSARARLD